MTYEKFYFYKCPSVEYAPVNDYFDHSNGVVGFKTVQKRAKYIGCMTIEELEGRIKGKRLNSNRVQGFGRRAGYANVSRGYGERY